MQPLAALLVALIACTAPSMIETSADCPENYSECGGSCYRQLAEQTGNITTAEECYDTDAHYLPSPSNLEDVQCLRNIIGNGQDIWTAYYQNSQGMIVDEDGNQIPAEIWEDDGEKGYCAVVDGDTNKIKTAHCSNENKLIFCQLIPDEDR